MGDQTAAELAEALAGVPQLRQLRLSYGSLGDAGARALGAALVSEFKPPNLEALWLGGNLIGDAGARALARALGPNDVDTIRPLHTLALYSNQIGADGLARLGEALKAREQADASLGPASVTLYDNADGAEVELSCRGEQQITA